MCIAKIEEKNDLCKNLLLFSFSDPRNKQKTQFSAPFFSNRGSLSPTYVLTLTLYSAGHEQPIVMLQRDDFPKGTTRCSSAYIESACKAGIPVNVNRPASSVKVHSPHTEQLTVADSKGTCFSPPKDLSAHRHRALTPAVACQHQHSKKQCQCTNHAHIPLISSCSK